MKIAILGRGTMAGGIVQLFAQNGHSVKVWVRTINPEDPQESIKTVVKNLGRLVEKGKIAQEDMDKTLSNINITTDLNELNDTDLVIEAIAENMDLKKEIFKKLDEICPKSAILATNTSSLSITEIASATSRPEKVIGMHFFNPVPLMKLVEVIKGLTTSDETKNQIVNMSKELGKTPVEVEEAPGFVVNRVLIPMINEAVGILSEGIATETDIDAALKLGANHPMGPLELGDLIGLDVCLAIMKVLYEEFRDTKYRPHPLLVKMVRANKLGRKTKEGFYKY